MKKGFIIALCTSAMVFFTACSAPTSPSAASSPAASSTVSGAPSASVSAGAEASAGASKSAQPDSEVIAIVDDTKIYMSDLKNITDSILSTYGIAEGSEYYDSMYESVKVDMVQTLIMQEVQKKKAKELGMYELTDEEKQTLEDTINSYRDSWRSEFDSMARSENPDATDEEIEATVNQMFEKYEADSGFTVEYMTKVETDSLAIQKLYEKTTANVSLTDTELLEEYNSLVAKDKEAFATNASTYEEAVMYEQEIYYVPEGFRTVKHILVGFDDETTDQIQQLSGEDKEAALKLREESAKKIKAEADEVYNLIKKDASNFDDVMQEKTDDAGSLTNPDGYTIGNFGTTSFAEEFTKASFELKKPGEFCKPILSNFGYHIILYVSDVPSGEVPFEDVRDSISETATAQKQTELYQAECEKWLASMNVQKFPEVYAPTPTPSPTQSPAATPTASSAGTPAPSVQESPNSSVPASTDSAPTPSSPQSTSSASQSTPGASQSSSSASSVPPATSPTPQS